MKCSHEIWEKDTSIADGFCPLCVADENERLRAALRDAHLLIDNDLVGPWIMTHKLDDVLGIVP